MKLESLFSRKLAWRRVLGMGLMGSALALTACGGGGGATGSAGTAPAGAVNFSVTDGPGTDYDHVWVTITQLSFHTDSNAVWSPQDATWQNYKLATPVTVDLAALNNGALSQVFSGLSLPVGTYKQIRLFMAGFDDALTNSAQAIKDNQTTPSALQWNDQVEYTDTNGNVVEAPLEMAYPKQGIQLNGTFAITANSTLNLVADFDLEHDVVKYLHGSQYSFTMKPNLHYFDMSQVGAITGQIDTASLCAPHYQGHYAGISNPTACGYNLIVKAETLSANGTRHVDARATTVKADGSFTLFPVLANTTYDVLIRGRNIQTSIVKGVTVTQGSTPTSGATQISTLASPITPTVTANNEYFANFNTALNPSSAYVLFQQSIGSDPAPYDVRWGNTNPYTGLLQVPMALQLGAVNVATFVSSGAALNFMPVTPNEGSGAYSVAVSGLGYYTLSSNTTLAPAAAGTLATLSASNSTLSAGVVSGSVSGTLSTTPGRYDKAYLVFSRFANVVETLDISAQAATGSGSYTVTLPAGTASAPVKGAYYYAYVRAWDSAHPRTSLKVTPANGFADLRTTDTVSGLNVSF